MHTAFNFIRKSAYFGLYPATVPVHRAHTVAMKKSRRRSTKIDRSNVVRAHVRRYNGCQELPGLLARESDVAAAQWQRRVDELKSLARETVGGRREGRLVATRGGGAFSTEQGLNMSPVTTANEAEIRPPVGDGCRACVSALDALFITSTLRDAAAISDVPQTAGEAAFSSALTCEKRFSSLAARDSNPRH